MFQILKTGKRVEGSHHAGDFLLRLYDRFLDFKDDLFARPTPPRLYITSI
jgi:hypothetical protein